MRFRLWSAAVIFCSVSTLAAADIFQLPIGDPALKERRVPLTLDAIREAGTGETVSLGQLVDQLEDVNLLFVGESHATAEVHQIEERIIRALADSGRRVLVGLEMFPYTEQESLDRWNRGYLSEEGFVVLADWYRNWGFNWRYYRSIFLAARELGIPMFAINTPRSVVSAVRQKGFEGLSEEERTHLPESIDTEDEDHLRLFKAYFEQDGEGFHSPSGEQLQGLFNAQCTWDASMAQNATRALERFAEGNPIMVVLIGAGHVAYGLGIERQAAQWFEGRMASLVPLPVDEDEPEREIQASYADYVWGYLPERFPRYPSLGISTHPDQESGQQKIIYVEKDSVAQRAGLETGDVLIAADGETLEHRSQLNRIVSARQWGDSLTMVVERDGEQREIIAHFRRVLD